MTSNGVLLNNARNCKQKDIIMCIQLFNNGTIIIMEKSDQELLITLNNS